MIFSLILIILTINLSMAAAKGDRTYKSQYSSAQKSEKIAYLTFDDGPSNNTYKILQVLKKNNIKATFFVKGIPTEWGLMTYKKIIQEGHAIGLHSYTHNYEEIYRSLDHYMEDHQKLSNLLSSVGINTKVLRFPGGSNNTVSRKVSGQNIMPKIAKKMTDLGFTYFDWNIDSLDAKQAHQNKQVIIDAVLNGSRDKNIVIILMHDAPLNTTTPEALPIIIEGLRKQGFTFGVLTEGTPAIQFIHVR